MKNKIPLDPILDEDSGKNDINRGNTKDDKYKALVLSVVLGIISIAVTVYLFLFTSFNSTFEIVGLTLGILSISFFCIKGIIKFYQNDKSPSWGFIITGILIGIMLIPFTSFAYKFYRTDTSSKEQSEEINNEENGESIVKSDTNNPDTELVQFPVEIDEPATEIENENMSHDPPNAPLINEERDRNENSENVTNIDKRPVWALKGKQCYLRLGVVRNGVWAHSMFKDVIHDSSLFDFNMTINKVSDNNLFLYGLNNRSEKWQIRGKEMEFKGIQGTIDTARVNGDPNYFWCYMKFIILN